MWVSITFTVISKGISTGYGGYVGFAAQPADGHAAVSSALAMPSPHSANDKNAARKYMVEKIEIFFIKKSTYRIKRSVVDLRLEPDNTTVLCEVETNGHVHVYQPVPNPSQYSPSCNQSPAVIVLLILFSFYIHSVTRHSEQ